MLNRRSLLSKGLGISAVAGLAMGAAAAVSDEPKATQNYRSLFHDPFYYSQFLKWVEIGNGQAALFSWHDFEINNETVYTSSRELFAKYYEIIATSEEALRERIENDCKAMMETHAKFAGRGRDISSDFYVLIEKGFTSHGNQFSVHVALAILPFKRTPSPASIEELAEITKILRPATNSLHQKMWELGSMEPVYFPLQPLT